MKTKYQIRNYRNKLNYFMRKYNFYHTKSTRNDIKKLGKPLGEVKVQQSKFKTDTGCVSMISAGTTNYISCL